MEAKTSFKFKVTALESSTYQSQPDSNGVRHVRHGYVIKGMTSEQLVKFKELQGEYYRECTETGLPRWSDRKYHGKRCTLVVTERGIFADNDDLIKCNSFVNGLPEGPLQAAMATQAAKKLMGQFFGTEVTTEEE